MIRVALRGLTVRRLRLALTALAVALGVTLIAGTYVFTDTINASFDRIFVESYRGIDVVVTPRKTVQTEDGSVPPMREAVLAQVRDDPGIARAEGAIFDPGGTILGRDGKPVGAGGGAPNFIASAYRDDRFNSFEAAQGRLPRGPDEAALDKATADRERLRVGGTLDVQGQQPRKRYRLVGIVRISGVDSFGGAAVALLTLGEAQRITGKTGRLDEIDASVARGAEPAVVLHRLRATLGPGAQVRTGAQQAARQSADIRDNLGFIRVALLAFAGISLFVGAFIIFNTFSITVAQRTRELGLLRTLGASRRQVLASVLAEGLLIGVLGAAAGLALGLLVAKALRALFQAVGVDLPSSGTVVETRTIVVSLGVGVAVTVLSSLAPALRATRVPPIAALREGAVLPPGRAARYAAPLAGLLTLAGLGLLLGGLFVGAAAGTALSLAGIGAALLFVGVALLSPRLVGPIAALVGRPLERAAGITGRLARANAVRQPGRTAATAAALMVGVALVAFASIFAASARTTIRQAVQTGSQAQAIVVNQDGFSSFSPEVARAVRRLPGVQRVTALGRSRALVDGRETGVTGIEPATFTALYDAGAGVPALRRLGPLDAVVRRQYAEGNGTKVGDVLRVLTPARRALRLRVGGIVEDRGQLLAGVTVRRDVLRTSFGGVRDGLVLVGYAGGRDDAALKHRLDALLARAFPEVEARTNEQFIADQAAQVDQLLGLIYALLALAVIVSLFGIVNTLVLSITERTRELGMLRAIGTSRRQVRRMIRYEAVITALIGGLLGTVLGVALAVLVSRVVQDLTLAVPVLSVAVLLVLAGFAGVLAAVLPARRAARLDVLEALAYE